MAPPEADEQILNRTKLPATRIGFGDSPMVLVVDLQNVLTNAEWEIGTDLSEVIEHTNELTELARAQGRPVVYIRNVPYPNGEQIGKWAKLDVDPKLGDPETEAGRLDSRLDVHEEDSIVDKRQASAFHETPLDSMLTHWGIDTVLVCGVSTSGCIRATAIDSCANGYRTILPIECIGDRSPEQHEANVQDIHTRIGDVIPLAEVTEYLGSIEGAD